MQNRLKNRFFTRLPIPVVAGVSAGQLAAAAGCQLVAACDIVVAAKGSRFSTPGSNFGLYCSTPGVPLARWAYCASALALDLCERNYVKDISLPSEPDSAVIGMKGSRWTTLTMGTLVRMTAIRRGRGDVNNSDIFIE